MVSYFARRQWRSPLPAGFRVVTALGVSMRGRRKNFTPSEDALIRQQPVTGIDVKRLAQILRTNQEAIRHRATELGVSLVIGAEGGGAIGTRTLRCTNGPIDPLLKRLKDAHGKIRLSKTSHQ
jgi:hypothetical protein